MTENNAAQPVITDVQIENIRIRAEKDSRRFGPTVDIPLRADLLLALLSKLRAEGVQAGDLPTMQSAFRITEQHGDPDPAKRQYLMVFKFRSAEDMNAADDEWRAALASAPVAGEAQPDRQAVIVAIHRYGNARAMAEHNIAYRDEVRNTYDALIALFDAAPQASEAVPVAWAIFSPSGNIRYWHRDKSNVDAFAAKHSLTVCGLANAGPTSKDAEQIADLVLGHAEGLRVSSLLESGTGFGKDVEHRFQVSNGEDRYGVVIILTALSAQPGAQRTGGSDAN